MITITCKICERIFHTVYTEKYVLHKKTHKNLGCTLISAVCHIKNNTSLGLY